MNPVVEHSEIRSNWSKGRPHQEGGFRIIARHFARGSFQTEYFSHDKLHALLGIFAHDPFVVGIRDILGEHVLNIASLSGGVERFVNTADPLLLYRQSVNGRDLDRLRSGNPRGCKCRCSDCGCKKHPSCGSKVHWHYSPVLVV